jgi:hypothetical protein
MIAHHIAGSRRITGRARKGGNARPGGQRNKPRSKVSKFERPTECN